MGMVFEAMAVDLSVSFGLLVIIQQFGPPAGRKIQAEAGWCFMKIHIASQVPLGDRCYTRSPRLCASRVKRSEDSTRNLPWSSIASWLFLMTPLLRGPFRVIEASNLRRELKKRKTRATMTKKDMSSMRNIADRRRRPQ